jgi:hypothetical protein
MITNLLDSFSSRCLIWQYRRYVMPIFSATASCLPNLASRAFSIFGVIFLIVSIIRFYHADIFLVKNFFREINA